MNDIPVQSSRPQQRFIFSTNTHVLMNAFCTRLPLVALALAALCTTNPAEAQTARKAVPAKAAETPATRKAEPVVARNTTTQSAPASRPAPAVRVGRAKYLNAGIGLAAYYGGGLPLGASFEVEIKKNVSVGGSVDYLRYGYNSGGYKWNYTFIYAGARGSYHLGEALGVGNDKFDPYVGATLGFRHASYKDNYGYNDYYSSPYNSGLFLGVHLGSRYLFSEKIGGFAEVGYGVSALRLGVTAKF